MKLIAIALIAALCFTWANAEVKGTDLQNMLAKESNTFLILFYDPKADLPNDGKDNLEAEVQQKILNKKEFKDYKFFTLDATDSDATDLVEQAAIDLEKLKHHPIIAASRNGMLVWYYGEGAVDELVKVAHTFTHEDGYDTKKTSRRNLQYRSLATEPTVKTYEDLRTHLESSEGTTLVMFFDPEAKVDKKNQMIKDVNSIILSNKDNKDVEFMQSSLVADQVLKQDDRAEDPALMVDELGLDVVSLKHQPTIAAFRNGWATWVHGDKAVEVLNKKLADFDKKAKLKAGEDKARRIR